MDTKMNPGINLASEEIPLSDSIPKDLGPQGAIKDLAHPPSRNTLVVTPGTTLLLWQASNSI